jgi:hypothetical protein
MDSAVPPPTSSRPSLSRKPFTVEEDARLMEIVSRYSQCKAWDRVAAQMEGRTARQCRERWIGYLSPCIRVEPWTPAEDHLLLTHISRFGHQWTAIARYFNGRSDNDVKNRWYSHLKDITVQGPDGSWVIIPELDASASPGKRKRKRKLVSPACVARDSLEQKSAPQSPPAFSPPVARFPSFRFSDSDFQLPPLLPRPQRPSH